jgi:hypothetical protein
MKIEGRGEQRRAEERRAEERINYDTFWGWVFKIRAKIEVTSAPM